MSVLRLAIPSPLRQCFDYLPPAGVDLQQLEPGVRLRVPFGPREVIGYLVAVVPLSQCDIPKAKLKAAVAVLEQTSLLPASLFQLCLWAARYYHHPIGEVIPAAFPVELRKGKAVREPGEPAWRLSTEGKGLPEGALARSPKQAQAIALLQCQPFASNNVLRQAGISSTIMSALAGKKLVEQYLHSSQPEPFGGACGLALTNEQEAAVKGISAAKPGFSCHLLEGITGSGKTEVYLQLIDQCLRQGKQALVLIPEIGLTPQTEGRFRERFGDRLVVLHSGLGDATRSLAWNRARSGHTGIVLGTRSAIFVPLAQPGLIIVDEEHDGAYKQQDGFRYHARDVAVKRGQLEGLTVVLGSATPSLESLRNALEQRYGHYRLNNRAGGGELPALRAFDIRKVPLQSGFSENLLEAVTQTLERGHQVLLFLNKRGYAASLRCHQCGWIAECHQCDARLTIRRRQKTLRCHHCGYGEPVPESCPQCSHPKLLGVGLGTEQVEEFLQGRFPGAPIFRVDSDTVGGRDGMAQLADKVNRGDPCILVGTQMLTKGHHFPQVALVAVLDADGALFSADFRGEERMAQLLTQVAGRAGRAQVVGRVIVQTRYPDHPRVQALLTQSYHQQARDMLAQRGSSGLPPLGQLVILHAEAPRQELAEEFLTKLRNSQRRNSPADVQLVGPLPSPMQRRAGQYRFQLLISSRSRAATDRVVRSLADVAKRMNSARTLRWFIDVDPQDVS